MTNKKPNVIFFVMDALRTKNLRCYGYKRNTSPNIDSLAKNGTLFSKFFSTNNSTDNSFMSILSGRHILKENTFSPNAQDNLFYTKKELKSFFDSGGIFLQEILKKNNYETYCLKYIHGWQKRGFDYYLKENSRKPIKTPKNILDLLRNYKKTFNIIQKLYYLSSSKFITCHLAARKIKNKLKCPADEQTTNEAINIIKKNKGKKNFFMWIDYADTHMPYNPGKFAGKFGKHSNVVKNIIARYDEAIFYNDYLIGKILKTLKEEKLFDNTIIFFLSDHGESLDEHQIYFCHHGPYDVSFNPPLIIHGKNLQTNRIDALTQLEDIAPTVLNLLGIKYNPSLFDGQTLVPLIKNQKSKIKDSIFMEECYLEKKTIFRTEKYKYTEAKSKKDAKCRKCNKIHGGIIELYNLKKDPDEKRNIAKENKKLLIEMKTKLDKKIKNLKITNEKRRLNKILSKI